MRCNLPIDEKGTLGDVECLLVGTVQEHPVVAPPIRPKRRRTSSSWWRSSIRTCTLLGSIANIVSVKLHETTLAAVMTVEQWGYPYAQLLEIPHPDHPDRESILLLVNGTENVYMLDLRMTTEAATGLKLLKASTPVACGRPDHQSRPDRSERLPETPSGQGAAARRAGRLVPAQGKFWNSRNFRTQANSPTAEVRTL